MSNRFVDVLVEPHAALPDGCSARWKATGPTHPVSHIPYCPDDGPDDQWHVEAAWQDGRRTPAQATLVDDSASGTSLLVHGGDLGLRLHHPGQPEHSEPYLLVAPDSVT